MVQLWRRPAGRLGIAMVAAGLATIAATLILQRGMIMLPLLLVGITPALDQLRNRRGEPGTRV